MMTELDQAAGRLRNLDHRDAVLLSCFGHDVVASMSLASSYDIKGVAHAAANIGDQYSRLTDPRPVDEAFARWVAGDDIGSAGWSRCFVESESGVIVQLMRPPRGQWRLMAAGAIIDNPTIGQFWMACKLFGVEVNERSEE